MKYGSVYVHSVACCKVEVSGRHISSKSGGKSGKCEAHCFSTQWAVESSRECLSSDESDSFGYESEYSAQTTLTSSTNSVPWQGEAIREVT